jgi:hypothetical protein
MQILIDHTGSDAFYTDAVNMLAQYRSLLKRPGRKVENMLQTYKLLGIAAAVMFAIMAAMTIAWGSDTLIKVLMALLAVLLVFDIAYYLALKKLKKRMMEDKRTSILTLDENGVELNKEDSQVVRIGWDNLAFVRVYGECIGFVSKDVSGLILFVERRYEDQVIPYVRENAPGVEIIA